MKKMILMALLLVSQLTHAAEVTRMSKEQAQTRVEKSLVYKQIEKKLAEGKSLTSDPVLAGRINDVLNLTLKDVVIVDNSKLMNLLNVDAMLTMSEIARQASIVKDKNSNAQEIANAKKAIELLALAGKNINTTAKNDSEAKELKEQLATAIEASDRVAKFEYSKTSKEFQEGYESALKKGKSPKDAVLEASKGKFTLEDILKCIV